ncbi:MAG: ABC transporter permease, partial [Vicinamibacterales bacterium]
EYSRSTFDELRYAIRRLKKQPAATLASVGTLALAIGVAVTAWSVLSAVLIRPLPLIQTDGLVTLGQRATDAPATVPFNYSRHTYRTFGATSDSAIFEQVSAMGTWPARLSLEGAVTSRGIAFVTPEFFETLGVRLRAGRGFLPEDDRPGAAPVAIVSDRFWRRALDSDTGVIGRVLVIGDRPVTIVGVGPEGFNGFVLANEREIFVPIHTVADLTANNSNWLSDPSRKSPIDWLQVVGRLRPGVDPAEAAARVAALEGETGRLYVATDLATAALAGPTRPALNAFAILLASTVGLLLLIGCLTVGMFVLLRTEARRDEFALSLALGASRSRLAGGVLLEALVLSTAGTALAAPLSLWLLAGVRAFQLPGNINIDLLTFPFDWRTLAISAAAAGTATVLIALVAGLFGVAANVADTLRSRAGATARLGRRRTRTALCVIQMAVALVLLAGAGLFTRSLSAALQLNQNGETGRTASGYLNLPSPDYTPARRRATLDDLRDRLTHDPLIRSASVSAFFGGTSTLGIDGAPRKLGATAIIHLVDDRYFATLGLPLLKGRSFTMGDRDSSPSVIIVSESLGRIITNGGDPVGRHVGGCRSDLPRAPCEIVGVVPDLITSIESLSPLRLYRPIAQAPDAGTPMIVLRGDNDSARAIGQAIAILRTVAPTTAVPTLETIDAGFARQMGAQHFAATVLGALGTVAALLTLLGMYVLAESMAAVRQREMGVRAALGATRSQLSALVFKQTSRFVGLGIAVGLLLTWLGSGLIRTFLFRVEAFDLTTIGAVVILMAGLAIAVTLRPALRSGRVDLARLLREE